MATLHKLQGAQNFELEGGEETGEIPDGSKNSRTISVEDLKIDVTGQPSSLLLFFFFFFRVFFLFPFSVAATQGHSTEHLGLGTLHFLWPFGVVITLLGKSRWNSLAQLAKSTRLHPDVALGTGGAFWRRGFESRWDGDCIFNFHVLVVTSAAQRRLDERCNGKRKHPLAVGITATSRTAEYTASSHV
jgi:hypothetical protein